MRLGSDGRDGFVRRLEVGKKGSRPSLGELGVTNVERITTSGSAGLAGGPAVADCAATTPVKSNAAAPLLKLMRQFISLLGVRFYESDNFHFE